MEKKRKWVGVESGRQRKKKTNERGRETGC